MKLCELLSLTKTLSPEYVSEPRLLCVRLLNCGMKRDVLELLLEDVSFSVRRSILETLCSSILVCTSSDCVEVELDVEATMLPLISDSSGVAPFSKKYSYC